MDPLDYLNPDLDQFQQDIDSTKGLGNLFNVMADDEPMNIEDYQNQNIEDRPIGFIPNNFLNYQFQNARTPFTPIREGIASVGDRIGSLKDKSMDLFDSGKDLALRGIGSIVGGPIGSLIAGLLGNIKESPEQRAMRDFYEGKFGLTDTGQLASGIMQGYNPVYGLGESGLSSAIDKRLATILRTEQNRRAKDLELSQDLKNRRQKLQDLRAQESKAASDFLESQRRGTRPTAPSGDRGRGGADYSSAASTGAKSGFGYGL